jgi:7,8-dihydropterin-6-yl-methyl-4-(beta-D-ribofuranosyl)aminobenzene 5'-phosphate synthase
VAPIHTVVGGTHLIGASEERVLRTATAFQELGVQRVGVSHCTGLPSSILLSQHLGGSFFFNNTGTSITIP